MKKKGAIELQFNWLFVLIVGAMLLIFFFGLIRTLSKSSKESLNYDILNYLDEILAGVGVSSQTEYGINLPGTTVSLDCSFITIDGSDLEGKSVESRVIFGPDKISKEMKTYTLFWQAPFNTAYFLYASSPKNKYLIIKDAGNFYEKVYKSDESTDDLLPMNMNREVFDSISDLGSFENQNFDKIKIIAFAEINPSDITMHLKKIKNKDVNAIRIIPDNDLTIFPDGTGKVEFYSFDGSTFTKEGESTYLNRASLAGAIFAENKEMYDCNMDKAYARLGKIADIQIKKTNELKAYDDLKNCDNDPLNPDNYIKLNDALGRIKAAAENKDAGLIFAEQSNLNLYNKNLQKQSCPIIY